jgi:chorismate mutase
MTIAPPPSDTLAKLRAKLDALDDHIHDLFMQRAKVVENVATEGGKTGTKIRPGREAIILRRLLARHAGALPRQAIVRIWREMFGAALIIEGGQTMAVCDGEGGEARMALAREHFGPLTPSRRHANPAQTLADLTRESGAQLAVLPAFAESEDSHGGWWPLLTGSAAHRLHVIAKIPFWTRRAEGLPQGEAYVVATVPPDPSGQDHGLIAFALTGEVSRASVQALIKAAGFELCTLWVRRMAGDTRLHVLAEVDGLIPDDDGRLAGIAGTDGAPIVIGGFAVPLDA